MAELGIAEAAAALGVSVDTVRRRIRRGELEARKDPQGHYLVTVDEDAAPVAAPSNPDALRELQRELDHTRELLEEARGERDYLRTELHDVNQKHSHLQVMLGEAQKALLSLPTPAGEDATQSTTQPAPPTPTPKRTRLWWKK